MISRLRPPLPDINWLVSIIEERVYCAVRTNLEIQFWLNLLLTAAPRLRRLAAGLASRRPCFDPRPVKVRLVLDQVALGKISLRVLRFSSVSYNSSYAQHSSSSKCCSRAGGINGRNLETSKKEMFFWKSGRSGQRRIFFSLQDITMADAVICWGMFGKERICT
jgi:hypothetical protein